MTNAIRPDVAVSLLPTGETQTRGPSRGKPGTLKGSVTKRYRGASGGWRRNDGKVRYMNQRGLIGTGTAFILARAEEPYRSGVRAAIVAEKRGNARGAKGRRKVEA
jgi:hypothetical protein